MSDRHIAILRAMARDSQRRLELHEATTDVADAGSMARRRELQRKAARTRVRVVTSEARRQRGFSV